MGRGTFIVFEGIDGSGKTTQYILLSSYLIEKGYNVLLTEEPTREIITGHFVKAALSHKEKFPKEVYLLLFVADRIAHVDKRIRPALEKGKIVISDRYYFSTYAYQVAQGIDEQIVRGLKNFLNINLPEPDIVFYIDVSPDVAIERLYGREKSTVELYEKKEFLEKVRENYLHLAEECGFIVIDGERDILEIQRDIRKEVEKVL